MPQRRRIGDFALRTKLWQTAVFAFAHGGFKLIELGFVVPHLPTTSAAAVFAKCMDSRAMGALRAIHKVMMATTVSPAPDAS